MTRPAGFSLIEVMLALAVFAVGAVGVLGLFPIAAKDVDESLRHQHAATIASSLFAELRAASEGFATLPVQNGILQVSMSSNDLIVLKYDRELRLLGLAKDDDLDGNGYLTELQLFPGTPTPGTSTAALAIRRGSRRDSHRFVSILRSQ